MLVNKSMKIRLINNTDLPIILYKPDRNVSQIIDKWCSNCKNMLILQLAYPRVGRHFWDGPEMMADIFILQHGDQANLPRLPTCWHSLSSASVFFGFSEMKLQYSLSYFVILQYLKNWWNKLLYCSVLRNWNIYYSHFSHSLVLLIQPYHCILSRNVVTVVSVS